jgi:hypothetical protein
MISDSARGASDYKRNVIQFESKVIRVSEDLAIGSVGDSFLGQLVRNFDWYEFQKTVNNFPHAFAKEVYRLVKEYTIEGGSNPFLIAYEGDIYFVDTDYSVTEIPWVYAIGCGADICLGVLNVIGNRSIKSALIKAMQTANKYYPSVCEPFNLICQTYK